MIKAVIEGVTVDVTFNVVEPTSETSTFISSDTFPAGVRGVGMRILVVVKPQDVSFEKVQIKELGAPNTNVSGFYTKVNLGSHAESSWVPLNNANQWIDHAWESGGDKKYWEYGTRSWDIPVRWKVRDQEHTSLPNHLQEFTVLDVSGTSTVKKLDQTSPPRTP